MGKRTKFTPNFFSIPCDLRTSECVQFSFFPDPWVADHFNSYSLIRTAMDIAPVANSYYENFLELLAQILSRAVTTKEQEAILNGLRDFQEKLKRLSR